MPQQPPPEDFDLKQWIAEIKADGGLPDDQVTQLESILGTDKAKSVLKRSVSNHKDWTRKTMEAADLRKQADADRAAMEQEKQQLQQWQAGVQSQLDDAYKQYQESNISAATLKAKVQTIASRYGIDPKELLEGELPPETQPTKGTPVANIDVSKFVTADDLDKQFGRLKSMDSRIQAQIWDLGVEHQKLFGTPLENVSAMVDEALGSKEPITLRAMWEKKHNVQAKRDELLRAQIRQEEHEKVDAELRTKYSAQSADGQRAFMPQMPQSEAYKKLMGDAKIPDRNGSDKSMARIARATQAWEDTLAGKG